MTTPRVYTSHDFQWIERQKKHQLEFILLSDHKEVVKTHQELNRKLANHNDDLNDKVKRQAEEIERLKGVIDKWSAANLRQTEAIEKLKELVPELRHYAERAQVRGEPKACETMNNMADKYGAILQEAK